MRDETTARLGATAPNTLVMMLKLAPVVPPGLLEELLASTNLHPFVLSALLRRHEIPLLRLNPLCLPLSDRPWQVAVAYLLRPELDQDAVARLLGPTPPARWVRVLVNSIHVSEAAAAAAFPHLGTDDLPRLVENTAAPLRLRAQALARYADQAPSEDLDLLLERAPKSGGAGTALANATAPLTTNPHLLELFARRVTSTEACDHVAQTWLVAQLAVPLTGREQAHTALAAVHRMAGLCSPTVREEIATWCANVTVGTDVKIGPGYNIADLITQLRDAPMSARRWTQAMHATNGPYPHPELATVLVEAFGDDLDAWNVCDRIADGFTGTVAELVETVHALTQPAQR